MKKSLIMVLALFVAAAMLLSACGQAKKPEATTAPESVAEEVSEAAEEVKEEASEAVSEAAEEVTEAISEAAEDISEAASEAAEEVTEAVSEVVEEVSEAAEEVKEEAADAAEEVKEEASEAVEEVKEEASDTAEEVKEEVSEAVEEVKEEASDTAEEVKEEASETVEEVKEDAAVVEDAKDKAEEVKEEAAAVVEDAKDKAEEVVEDVKDKAEEVVEDVKDKAEEVKEEAAAVVEDAKDKAEEIVEDVTAEAEETAEEAAGLTAPMTYEEYAAAEIDDEVFVEAYVQNHQSWWEDKITVYAADEDGAYFIYEMACSEEDATKLVPGTKILVKGYKAEWSGEVEIADATFEFAEEDGEGYIAEAEDITELLGKDELIDHMNEFVSFKGLTIELSKDADGKEAPFLYNWDGSGTQGDDLYFNASINGETFTFTVESYLCDKDTDVYKAVEALKAGDVVDMEGFLYWYNGANPHITSVTVKEAKEEAVETAEEAKEDVAEAAEEVKEEAVEAVEEVKEDVSEAAEEVKEDAAEAAEEVKEEAVEAVEEVKEDASNIVEDAKDKVVEAVEEVKDTAAGIVEGASEVIEEAKDKVVEAVEDAKDIGAGIIAGASDVVEDIKDKVVGAVEDVKEGASEKAEEAAEAAEEVKEDASEAIEEVKEEAAAVVEDAKDKAEEVKEEAATVIEDAKDKAEEIVEDVTAEAKEVAEETVEEAAGLTAPMTYAEYAAAEIDDEVFVEAYVQNHQSWWEDKITVYAADEDGAYFIYEMECSEEDAAKLVPGTKILVKGYKAEWSGEVEIADATFEFAEEDGEGYIAEAEDITELLGKDELIDHMNEFVSFKGLTIELSKDADGKEAPFLYNWDGSGTQGDDLYFNASINGETFTFTVESYLCDKDTDVYKAVEALKAGDVVDMEGFLYWYNGANPHIISVTVVK